MKRAKNEFGKLSEAEMEVMQVIWNMVPPVTVPRVLKFFTETRGWKASTLSTIMKRLIEKGFLKIIKHGKPNIYAPTLSEEDYKKHETNLFLKSVHNGSIRSFISALSDGSGISRDELSDIREWFSREKEGDK